MSRDKKILLGIIVLGAVLRLLFLSSIPNGFFCDEAARGYDAYSIMLTQRDQYGEFMPAFTRSIDDYPESSYVYLTVPFIAIFGLTELATRLTAALAGILTIPVLYLLVKECFSRKTALIAALLLAINPWHIQFSRTGMGSYTLMPLVFCLALYFLIKGIRGRPGCLILSGVMFALSLYSYYSARVFIPLFLIGTGIIYFRELLENKKQTIIGVLIILAVLVPLSLFWISPRGLARASESLILSPLDNIRFYLSYFSPGFLFLSGDTQIVHSIKGMGQMYLFEVITVAVGLVALLVGIKKKEHRLILLWMLLYPFPAFLTGSMNAARTIIGAPLFVILSALGLFTLVSFFRSRWGKASFFTVAALVIALSFGTYCKRYFVDYPKYGASYWQYGMKEAIEYAEKSPYGRVIMSNSLFMAHSFVLFYTKVPPEECHKAMRERRLSFGKYRVSFISDKLKIDGPCLLIIEPYEMKKIPKEFSYKVLHAIKDPTGKEVIRIVEVKK